MVYGRHSRRVETPSWLGQITVSLATFRLICASLRLEADWGLTAADDRPYYPAGFFQFKTGLTASRVSFDLCRSTTRARHFAGRASARRRAHSIGAGGAGMRSLAEAARGKMAGN